MLLQYPTVSPHLLTGNMFSINRKSKVMEILPLLVFKYKKEPYRSRYKALLLLAEKPATFSYFRMLLYGFNAFSTLQETSH